VNPNKQAENAPTYPMPPGASPYGTIGPLGSFNPQINAFDPKYQPFVAGAFQGIENTLGYNQGLVGNAQQNLARLTADLSQLYGNQLTKSNQLANQFQGSYGPLINQAQTQMTLDQKAWDELIGQASLAMPVDPYSNEMLRQAMGSIQNNTTGAVQSGLPQIQQAFANRGLLNSTQAAGAEQSFRQQALTDQQGLNLGAVQNQLDTNVAANQQRNNILGQLQSGQTQARQQSLGIIGGLQGQMMQGILGAQGLGNDLTGQYGNTLAGLGGINANLGVLNRLDPALLADISSGLLGTKLGQENQQALLALSQQISANQTPSWGDQIAGLAGFFPGAQNIAPWLGIAGTALNAFAQRPYGTQGQFNRVY